MELKRLGRDKRTWDIVVKYPMELDGFIRGAVQEIRLETVN